MYKNTAYSSQCKLNIYFLLLKLQKWFSQGQWEIFSLLLFDSRAATNDYFDNRLI